MDGVGALFEAGGWPARLTTDPELDRTMLLEGCLFRLRRGGRHADIYGFLRLHEALAPTADEVAMLTQDYGALLASSHSAVAAVARHELARIGQLQPRR
ncbi:hypothetical protein GCM10029964_101680 [Kibdelosporangium lantanae]